MLWNSFFFSVLKLMCSVDHKRTDWKGWSQVSSSEPGEGQLSSVHAKRPEGLPGERADQVFSLRQQHLDQGAHERVSGSFGKVETISILCSVPNYKRRNSFRVQISVSRMHTQAVKFNHIVSSVCLSTSFMLARWQWAHFQFFRLDCFSSCHPWWFPVC